MAIESVGLSDEAEPGLPAQPGVPPAPVVSPDELWEDAPYVLYDGGRYTIGWQGRPENKGGPVFVTVRRTALDGRKVVERYPMTDQGWSLAWRDLVRLDPAAPEPVLAVLVGRIERQRMLAARRDLDARSLASVPKAIFIGGYLAGADFVAGQPDELRILLSRGISAVREARAAMADTGDGARQPAARSLVDELSRLAGLLDRGLLTRDEFDQLKARLTAGQ